MDTISHFIAFFLFSLFIHIDGRITSEKYMKSNLLHIKLSENAALNAPIVRRSAETVHRLRVRRGADTQHTQDATNNLRVHTTLLSDKGHNEAIVHWTGLNSSVMFILSRQHNRNGTVPSSSLWRSENYGSSFNKVSSLAGNPVISYYLAAPQDKRKLLFVDAMQNMIHTTINEGVSFERHKGCPTSTDKLVFHPSNETWVLCYSERDRKLYVSIDLCASWDLVHDYVNPRFFWGVPGYDKDIYTIHMEVLDPQSGHYYYKSVTYPYPRNITIDNNLGNIEVESLFVMNEYIFVQKSSRFAVWLYVSWKRQPFKMAFFPKNRHPEDLNIIDADEGQVFIAGSQPSSGLFYSISDLYLSDETGQLYISSLTRVTNIGLQEVHGLRGVYIANLKSGVGDRAALQTSITFDQGGNWTKLKAPEKDTKGNPTNCILEQGCSLHLTNIVSEETAPGIVLGVGNYGHGLTGFDNLTLFISTDGGLSWNCTVEKPDSYEANILDQGGAVVAVPHSFTSDKNVIHYSHDEGLTWNQYVYKNESMKVDAVLNDPGATTRTVVVFGHDDKVQGWVIVMIDFSNILQRKCTDEDYKTWIPTDQIRGHQCLLGQQMTYKRRKATSQCYNGQDYSHNVTTKLCPCIILDYECDYGYKEDEKGTNCIVESWFDPNKPAGGCEENGFYNKSKGYRRVASDKCINDMDKFKPVETKCPMMHADGLHIVLVGRRIIPQGLPVQFQLIQERGSKLVTKYSWNFGDGPGSFDFTGFDAAKNQNHTYAKRGLYTITVIATNMDGQSDCSLDVLVEDEIDGLYVEAPHGAQVGHPILFEVSLSLDFDIFSDRHQGVHFMWRFGDEGDERDQKLTWDYTVVHTYQKPDNYTVLVEAMNGQDSVFSMFPLTVYGVLQMVQLTFDSTVDDMNDGTVIWGTMFSKALKIALLEHLSIDITRIEVTVLKETTHTVADVTVLPLDVQSKKDETIQPIVNKLLALPKGDFVIPLSKDEFNMEYHARVETANIFNRDMPGSKNYTAVYICVPILIAAIFVSMLVVLYYKKTFSMARRRYRLIRNQETGPEPDSLLDDTDDDDPLLDPNMDDNNRRLALDDDDVQPSGLDPLGLLSEDHRNAVV